MTEAKTPRDFTYIKPRKRRLSEYEAVTCYTQPDPDVFDKQGWYLRTREGRPAWQKESTRLVHPHWFDFRDPAGMWQRNYVRMQAEQERTIERASADAGHAGAYRDFDPTWTREILGSHYRVWSFFEYGLFRCFAQAQRETLADTLGMAFCFEGVDRMRHAQAIVIYLMELEEHIKGLADTGAKQRWISDPLYQPLRRLTEELMAINDWAELAFVVNLVVDPIVSQVGASEIVRRNGAFHGDSVTPLIVSTTERDRRRNLDWARELVKMVTADDIPAARENQSIINQWNATWLPRAIAATEPLEKIFNTVPLRQGTFAEAFGSARAAQAELTAVLEVKSAEAA